MKLDKNLMEKGGVILGSIVGLGLTTYFWSDVLVHSLGILGVWGFSPEDFTGDTVGAVWSLHLYVMSVLAFLKWWLKW